MAVSLPRVEGAANVLALFAVVFPVVVFLNTSLGYVGYVLPGGGGLAFEGLSRQLFWVILVTSIYIASTRGYRMALLACFLAVAMVMLRVLSSISGGEAVTFAYRFSFSMIVALGSAVAYMKLPQCYRGLLKAITFVGIPILFIQLLGVSETAHFLNTLFLTDYGMHVRLAPTFLVGYDQLGATFHQMRPPGLFFTNAIAATFTIFAIAYRLSESIKRVTLYDAALVYTTLLLMAKIGIVFLVAATIVKYAVTKERVEVVAMRRFALMGVGLFLLHMTLFPGVVSEVLGWRAFVLSAGIRVVDFLAAIGLDRFFPWAVAVSEYGLYQLNMQYGINEQAGDFSGIGFVLIVTPLLIVAWRGVRKRERAGLLTPDDKRRSGFLIMALVFAFVANPILGIPLVGYLFGPALVPLLKRPSRARPAAATAP